MENTTNLRSSPSQPDSLEVMVGPLQEPPAILHVFCSPKLFKHTNSTQSLRPCLFEPMLVIQEPSLLLHCMTQKVCHYKKNRALNSVEINWDHKFSRKMTEPAMKKFSQ